MDCAIIRLEFCFWDRVLELLDFFGFPPLADTRAFLLLGMQSPDKNADPEAIGVLTLL